MRKIPKSSILILTFSGVIAANHCLPGQADEKRPSAALSSAFVNGVPCRYAFFLRISSALHLDIFDQPESLSFYTLPGSIFPWALVEQSTRNRWPAERRRQRLIPTI
jgi:hypothetical protein